MSIKKKTNSPRRDDLWGSLERGPSLAAGAPWSGGEPLADNSPDGHPSSILNAFSPSILMRKFKEETFLSNFLH